MNPQRPELKGHGPGQDREETLPRPLGSAIRLRVSLRWASWELPTELALERWVPWASLLASLRTQ